MDGRWTQERVAGRRERHDVLKVEQILPAARERLATVKTDVLLVDAAKLLSGPQRNLVVVCDESGKLAGVVSKTDVVNRIGHCSGSSCTMAVANVMTRNVVCCRPDDWLQDIWSLFKQHGLKNIPVVDRDSVPVGILNVRDALQVLLTEVEYEEQLLRDYVSCVGYQ
jgi:CBS domain-containing protein